MLLSGINLTLMIGPAVPVPVPKAVLDALTDVEVTAKTDGPSVFQLKFKIDKNSPLHTIFLLASGAQIPLMRVVIYVTMNGSPEVLIDGVMTDNQITPGGSGESPVLTITGEDLTRVMDYIDFTGIPYPAMPPEARVLLILAKYAVFGVIPMVIPSIMLDVPIPIDRIPLQQGTDLAYVSKLADDVGYVFFVMPGPAPGTTIAYWGPDIKVGVPQPALNIDMDAHTNVESLNFSFNSDAGTLPIVFIQEQFSKAPIPIPIPDITPLSPPLGLIPPIPKQFPIIEGTSKLTPIQAVLIGLAKAAKKADAVTGSGSLDVLRYGRLLKSRGLVGVRGAGMAFDGLYYVKSVTHKIKRGEYKQGFALARNGLVSTVSRVPA
ncbi:MAG: hypothetical protein DMG65_21580 [Candidatus Angelobacter sp. Gp1-AA117]|nr:MAG: hypothetical protein DMG65_21580 [Candidatus Angelobacter sp. Gp1-AA117]